MTKDKLIDLLNENIIKHNNPEEFKKLLTLSDEEAEFITNIKVSKETKRNLISFINLVKSLQDEDSKSTILSTLYSIKEENIDNYIKLITKLISNDHCKTITQYIKISENLITPLLTISNCNELIQKDLFLDALRCLLPLKYDSKRTLNSLSTILTNPNLIKSKWYKTTINEIGRTRPSRANTINALPGSFLFYDGILKSYKYEEILKSLNRLVDEEQIFILNEIIDETPNQKDFANNLLVEIINPLANIKPEFYSLFLKIAKSMDSFPNEYYYLQALKNIQNINSHLYSDFYYTIVTTANDNNDVALNKFYSILKDINSYPKFYAIKECLNDHDFPNYNYKEFILESLCKDLNIIHYNYPSLGILLSPTLLSMSNYPNLIISLHNTDSEYKVELLDKILDTLHYKYKRKSLSYLFAIDDEELLEEYILFINNNNIADDEEEWLEIFEISKKIKNGKLLEHFIEICQRLAFHIESEEERIKVLSLVADIKDSDVMKDVKNSIYKVIDLESEYGIKTKNEKKDFRFRNIISCLIKKNKDLLPSYFNIIFNVNFYNSPNYYTNIFILDKITSLEALQIIERIVNTELGTPFIGRIINFHNVSELKYIELLIKELETAKWMKDEVKVDHLGYILESNPEENRVLVNLLTSSNKLVLKHKEKLLRIILFSNSDEEVREKINKELLFSKNTKSDILETLFELSMFPVTYPLEDMLLSLTKEELVSMLKSFEDDAEITGKEEVFRGVGPLKFKLDNYMK